MRARNRGGGFSARRRPCDDVDGLGQMITIVIASKAKQSIPFLKRLYSMDCFVTVFLAMTVSLFFQLQRHKAHIAFAVDQEQDGCFSIFLGLGDGIVQLLGRIHGFLIDLDDHIAFG